MNRDLEVGSCGNATAQSAALRETYEDLKVRGEGILIQSLNFWALSTGLMYVAF
jgi:hypothetical protein